jgi:hypothetical protein
VGSGLASMLELQPFSHQCNLLKHGLYSLYTEFHVCKASQCVGVTPALLTAQWVSTAGCWWVRLMEVACRVCCVLCAGMRTLWRV